MQLGKIYHIIRGDSKDILGGVGMAITMKLLDTAASHAKPSMETAILCMR